MKALRTFALYTCSAFALGVLLLPVYWMLVSTLSPRSVAGPSPALIPSVVSLRAFQEAVARTDVTAWLRNSGFLVLATVALSVPLATAAGYALSRFRYPGVQLVGYSLLASRMLPSVLLSVPLYYMYLRIGALDTYIGLALAIVAIELPFGTWLSKGFFDAIPRDLEEAAEVDGCSLPQALLHITLPLSIPGLAAVAAHTAVLAWGEFALTSTLIQDPAKWTVPVGLASLRGQYYVDWGIIMAATLLFSAPILLTFAVLQRYLIGGLTAGAIKS